MIKIHDLALQPYEIIWQKMKDFTVNRDEATIDELWLLEHPPVYTQGQAGKAEHILKTNEIPIIQTDRGGQITYHGPGQLVAYVLMDLRRRNLGIRTMVKQLEEVLINMLNEYGIHGAIRCGAPGVYVNDMKIASIGLRVKNGCTYHGIALNVAMDLAPFSTINPCGFTKLQMTQMTDFVSDIDVCKIKKSFINAFLTVFES